MADLNVSLMPDHPKVQKLQAQIDILEAALKKSRADIIERVSNEYQAALNREKMLNVAVQRAKRAGSDQAAKVIHYNILKREVDTNRQIYDAMLQRVKESGMVSAMRASGVRIVDPAIPPGAPYKPNITRSAMAGMFWGSSLGVAFVFIRERSNRNLQQPGDTAFYLNIPELGVIPTATDG